MARSAAYLKSLRRKYKLGEFSKKAGRRITKRYEPNRKKRKVLKYYRKLGIPSARGKKLSGFRLG